MEGVRERCRVAGLDLVQAFDVADYHAVVNEDLHLPDHGLPHALGILIGNTRALWPRFVDTLRAEPARLGDAHPLQRFVEERVRQAVAPSGRERRCDSRTSHGRASSRCSGWRTSRASRSSRRAT